VKAGEALEEALRRELREELNVTATIAEEIHRTRHRYAEMERELELVFFRATLGAEAPENRAFEQIEWAERGRLPEYDWLPADRELVKALAGGGT